MVLIEPLELRLHFTAILPGDSNASGSVDGDDLFAIDAGFSEGATGYHRGDFDQNGWIDADDYWLVDGNYGKTNADKVGPRKPLTSTWAGGSTTHNGQVIEQVNIGPNARINVNHSNVTIRNCKINAGTQANAINVALGVTGLLIEDTEIIGSNGHAIYGHHWTARRLNMHHMGSDAMLPFSNVTIESSWIHELGMTTGSHADGAQWGWGGDAANGRFAENFIIRNNVFDMPIPNPGFASNAALFINPYNGDKRADDFLIEGNYFNGGNYTCYILGNTTNVRVKGNFFGRDYRYGILSLYAPEPVWENNRWMDTGELIPR